MARPKKGEERDATEFIGVRVPAWIKSGLLAIAEKADSPYSNEVIDALEKHLKSRGITQPSTNQPSGA